MTDCPNADIRDRLPDLVHNRLDESERAAVMAHVYACADCQAELELLRDLRATLVASSPRVNTKAIVASLPKPGGRVAAVAPRRRFSWTDWRVAAAITVIVAGASAALVVRDKRAHENTLKQQVAAAETTTVAKQPVPTPQPAPTRVAQAPTPSKAQASATTVASTPATTDVADAADVEAATTGRLAGLSGSQLKALIDDIEKMPALPLADPEPLVIKVDVRSGPSSATPGVR